MISATPDFGRAVMDIVVWLRSLGLGKYEAAFRENEITEKVLPNLTAEDLKDLGVSIVGHRRTCSMRLLPYAPMQKTRHQRSRRRPHGPRPRRQVRLSQNPLASADTSR